MEKKTKTGETSFDRMKKQFQSTQFKNGSYSFVMVAIVLAIVIFVNLIVGQLPQAATQIDLTSSNIYETGETTAEVVDNLENDVDILVIAENGSIDERIERFLNRYAELSSKLSITYKDPVLHPDVLTTYGVSTDTIVVSCEATGKTTTVALDDFITYDEYYLYYQGSYVEDSFDGEGLMTSAVAYVSADNSKILYMAEGHGESSFSDSVTDLLQKSNLSTSSLNLMEVTEIPDDCALLIFNAPTGDLANDELTMVRKYMRAGGQVLLIRGVTEKTLTNFDALMEDYGLEMVNEYIGDSENYYAMARSYYNFFPTLTTSDINVDSQSMILVSAVAGMTTMENYTDYNISITQVMTTGSKAFRQNDTDNLQKYLLAAKSTRTYTGNEEIEETSNAALMAGDIEETSEAVSAEETEAVTEDESAVLESAAEEASKEENGTAADEAGVSAEAETEGAGASEEESESETEEAEEVSSVLFVLTTPSMIDEQITSSYSNLGNLDEFINIVTSFFDDVNNVSIEAKSLETPWNTVTGAGIWNALFLGIIPAFSLLAGLYVWIRRRKA